MIFKTASAKEQYPKLHAFLRYIVEQEFLVACRIWGIEPVCTRVADVVEGESGVHTLYRAIDFRDEIDGNQTFEPHQISLMLSYFNTKFERVDGKPIMLHHSFRGGPKHIHLQVAGSLAQYKNPELVNSCILFQSSEAQDQELG